VGFCSAGAAPNSTGATLNTVWVDFASIAASIGTALYAELKRALPFAVLGIAPQYYTVTTLCSDNPDPPPLITLQDIATAALGVASPLAGPGPLVDKLLQYLKWYAFRAFCQCNTATPSCVAAHIHATVNDTIWHDIATTQYAWPAIPNGDVASGTSTLVFLPWNIGCHNVTVTLTADITGTQPLLNPWDIHDCVGSLYNQAHIAGTGEPVTIRSGGTGNNCPGIGFLWNNPFFFPSWFIDIVPSAGQTGTTEVIPDAPGTGTGQSGTFPTPACDNTTLCNYQSVTLFNTTTIQHLSRIVSELELQISNAAGATAYQLGTVHTVTGNGEFTTTDQIMGVLVSVTPASGSGLVVGDPDWLPLNSFVTLGDPNGWLRQYPVSRNPLVVLGAPPSTTKVGFTAGDTTGMTITELVAVPVT